MSNGDTVYWTSHTGKPRRGEFICILASKPMAMVKMKPTGQLVQISPDRLTTGKEH